MPIYLSAANTGLQLEAWNYTPPAVAAPTNLRSTATTSSSISLAWDSTAPAGSPFTLQRSAYTNGAQGPYTTVYTGTNKSYTDTGLNFGSIYFYQVLVTVGGVDSPYSAEKQTATAPQQLPTPTGLTLTVASDTEVDAMWNPIPNASSSQPYQLQRALVTNGVAGAFKSVWSSPDTYRNDTGLTAGTTYDYRVLAPTNAANYSDSDPSAPVRVTTTGSASTPVITPGTSIATPPITAFTTTAY